MTHSWCRTDCLWCTTNAGTMPTQAQTQVQMQVQTSATMWWQTQMQHNCGMTQWPVWLMMHKQVQIWVLMPKQHQRNAITNIASAGAISTQVQIKARRCMAMQFYAKQCTCNPKQNNATLIHADAILSMHDTAINAGRFFPITILMDVCCIHAACKAFTCCCWPRFKWALSWTL